MTTKSKIKSLQKLLKAHKIDALVVPSGDIHSDEYLPECFKEREFLSGFTGSAGTLLIAQSGAWLFTDGRYFLQAENELKGSGISLEKQVNYKDFLLKNFKKAKVAVNPRNLSLNAKNELKSAFKKAKFKLKFIDLVSKIYTHRPALPKAKIYEQDAKFQGLKANLKLDKIREKMREFNANYHFISSLDDIAWITNLRGFDIEFNPVFLSFLLICEKRAVLFVDVEKLDKNLIKKLNSQGFELKNYAEFEMSLKSLKKARVLIDPKKTSIFVSNLLKFNKNKIIKATNPSTLMKAVKNEKELNHIKDMMIADGVALCEFFAWLESSKNKCLSELDIDYKITQFRAKNSLFISNSFATIAAFGANSALPHYQAKPQKFSTLKGDGLLLIDSGGQYQNGTSDITRVTHFGEVGAAAKRDYTLILKALINLSRAIFPKNTALSALDSLARANLWAQGIEFAHGTGHGVGYFLNVHEAPISISHYAAANAENKALCGMISSIEPGIYRAGKYGIRLENLVAIKKAEVKESEFGEFLCFETLTLCPFERDLIDFDMLESVEISWLEAYNEKVFKALSPHLKGGALRWLERNSLIYFH